MKAAFLGRKRKSEKRIPVTSSFFPSASFLRVYRKRVEEELSPKGEKEEREEGGGGEDAWWILSGKRRVLMSLSLSPPSFEREGERERECLGENINEALLLLLLLLLLLSAVTTLLAFLSLSVMYRETAVACVPPHIVLKVKRRRKYTLEY